MRAIVLLALAFLAGCDRPPMPQTGERAAGEQESPVQSEGAPPEGPER